MIVIPDDDPATAHRIATIARQSSEPGTRIIVRTRYLAEIEPFTKAGVDRVVAALPRVVDKLRALTRPVRRA